MATYGQLLIGSGGGVIDHNKQSARQAGATLIIGLGGTGGRAVQMIKKEVYRQLKPDDVDAEIPTYDGIRYMIVDTDPSDYQSGVRYYSDIDPKREFFDISYNAIAEDFSESNWGTLAKDKALTWLNYEKINPRTASYGAGGIRQVGRYLLVKNSFEMYNRIQNEITLAMKASGGKKVSVHICAGISGGTGSGTFLDVCYMVRKAIKQLGVPAQVCGYFFLPDVNLHVPAIMNNDTISAYIKVNGYCAMQELDYCMNFDRNHDSFKMNYGNGITVDDSDQPVDLCYLISATNSNGVVLDNGFSYAMNVVTDHVMSFLSKVELPEGVAAKDDQGLTLEGHIANITKSKTMITLQNGAPLDYNVLGASIAEMPLSEIATYLGVKLFENIEGIYNKVPTKAERDGFQVMLKLTYDDIFREMMKDCAPQIPFGKRFDGSFLREKGVGPFNDLQNETYDKNCGFMERNAKTMMAPLGDLKVDSDAAGTSIISRIYKNLYERCVLSVEYGPFYAKRMLYGTNNEDLYKAVLGLIETNRERMKSEAIQEAQLKEAFKTAEDKAKRAHMLNAGSCAEAFQNALNNYCMHQCRATAYEKLEKVLTTVRDQMADLDHRLFNVLTIIMENLRDTFKENAKVFSEGIKDDSSYSWKILTINEVASQLDDTIKEMNASRVLMNMMMHMFGQIEKWTEQEDDNKICKLVSDFILAEFREATQKTMTDYLNIKFKTSTNQALADAIDNEVMQSQLWDKSSPLFWKSPSYNATITRLTLLSIPYDSQPIEMAAKALKETQGATIRKTEVIDKIAIMRFLSGIPMYAYQGLGELESAYELDRSFGRHLYEKGEDWNKILPSPIPYSRENGANERQEAKSKEIAQLWEAAKAAGILTEDELNFWNINCANMAGLESLVQEFKAVPEGDIPKLMAFETKAKAEADKMLADIKSIQIKITSIEHGYEETISLDTFVRSPKLVDIVRAQMENRKALNEMLANVELAIKTGGIENEAKDIFFNAVFTGVISHTPMEVKYCYDNYGMKEEVSLANPTMQYGKSATYQAFLTFQSLDADLKARIQEETNAALISSDEAAVARKKAAMEFISGKLEALIGTAYITHTSVIAIRDEVKAFYQDFMKAYQEFKMFNA